MSVIKKIYTGDEARALLLKGMGVVADAVSKTAGVGGRNSIIAEQYGSPTLTKDGFKTSKSISLVGVEGEGVKLIQDAAEKQNTQCGDSTTLVTTLSYELTKEGLKYIEKGCNTTQVKRGIMDAGKQIVDNLKKLSKDISKIDEVKHVAMISANGDEVIGNLIAQAVEKCGNNAVITVEESQNFNTELELAEGLEFDNGFVSGYFMTNPERQMCELSNPYILITDFKINSLKQILPLLETVSQTGKPLLIISNDIDNEALSALIVNNLKGSLKSCVVKAPSFGDMQIKELEDIAVLTGGNVISEKVGNLLEKVTLQDLGSCETVKVYANKTTLIKGKGDKEAIEQHVAEINKELDNTTSQYDKEKLKERIAKLSNGVAILKIGGFTDAERTEMKDRADDAVNSVINALKEGIVVGGGISLVRAQEMGVSALDNKDAEIGQKIVLNAMTKHIQLLANNAGYSGEVVYSMVQGNENPNYGMDMSSGKYCDLMEAGIIDSTKCISSAVSIACSTACNVLTCESVIVPDIDEAIKMAKLTSNTTAQYM